ncbi:MAG TPA: hypothetical protein VNZ03_03055, partial [Terriglobales bacterium]|nr:hypothetical protein [Terriglobales bacterium]
IKIQVGLAKTLLYDVFGILAILRYPLRKAEKCLPVASNQRIERLPIAAPGGSQQSTVGLQMFAAH